MNEIQPDHSNLIKRIDLSTRLIGLYDAPDPGLFEPLVRPEQGDCVFSFYRNWEKGKTLHITKEHHGCGGAGCMELLPFKNLNIPQAAIGATDIF